MKRLQGVAEGKRVKLTGYFRSQLGGIEQFLEEAHARFAYDELLEELRGRVVPNLSRFPRMGRRYQDHLPLSVEGVMQLEGLLVAQPQLREYLFGDYLILYTEVDEVVYLLSIRHHRQLSFDLPMAWN